MLPSSPMRDGSYYEFWVYILTSSGEEDRTDRKGESTLARLGGELGPGNALPGTIPQENALNQHGRGYIFGILRLALSPLRQLRVLRAALRMTE